MSVAPTTDDITSAVCALVAKGSGMDVDKVIFGEQNAPFPAAPCATVTPIADLPDGHAWTRDEGIENRAYTDPTFTDGPTIDETAYLSSEVSFSLQWFGGTAADLARRFLVWANSPAGRSEIARRGLTLYRTGAVRDLSLVTEDRKWEERRGLDLFLGIVSTITEDTGIVQSVEATIFPDEFSDRTPNNDRVTAEFDGETEP